MQAPYPLSEVNNFSFEFITDQGVHYVAYFLEYGFLFKAYPDFSDKTFTFNLDVINSEIASSSVDERIGITIVEMFNNEPLSILILYII